ncbi:hypothetical protein ROLI_003750 [Roseobacter fucihabitans]|uniref:Uncharacterized protein n=1 Tax=Roseobacter fucihabitans TaxID=1537242 RepID=A0ABZ2BNI4_9RHOB|nr:hypothetical protein [Roseobacter litoralis]MBC6963625.1 hypothetical protein [Roseobacter litoralis]
MNSEPSLAKIGAVLSGQCGGHVLAYHLSNNHASRVQALEGVVEYSYNSLIKNSHLNQDQGEDEMSVSVVEQLKLLGIQASHDTQTRGHCDVHVEGVDHFLWIGEAKIHRDYAWLEDGFKQLSTRYATGGYGQDHGEIIIYCRVQDGAAVLREWQKRLGKAFEDVEFIEDVIDTRLWFRTRHNCENSGLPFYIRHRLL